MEPLDYLLEEEVLSEEESRQVVDLVNEGLSLEQALLRSGVDKQHVLRSFSEYYGVPGAVFGKSDTLPQEVLKYVSEDSAKHYRIVPFFLKDNILSVACNDPEDLQVKEVLNFISSKFHVGYKLVFMLSEDLDRALQSYQSLSGVVDEALGTLESELDAEIREKKNEVKGVAEENLNNLKEDAPVTKIVATMLRYAVDGAASDIHVEPLGYKVIVRFRVDGVLLKSLELPQSVHSAVVARIKILANIRLDEKRRPQDGRFSATFDDRKIDFRVSVLPTNHGEKVVMRILDTERGVTSLSGTGISDYNLETIKLALKEPYGIILISGPTGSGKSTTLYSMMGEVDKLSKNVLSLEDPVEYNIEYVSQSQVRPEIGYTFAAGLRSALRQDPDIIMVGEIRDKETAQLAIQAALTGHLVLSTIHTNNSIGVIPRLIDMGVDPYLIAPTIKLAIAQRLARRLCPGTGKEIKIEGSLKAMVDATFSTLPEKFRDRIPNGDTMLSPEPSPGCASGTKGRIAITETFAITDEIQRLILNNGSEEDMYKAARKNGFMNMKEDAIIKALEHKIPYEEMNSFGTKVGVESLTEELIIDSPNLDELGKEVQHDV